MLGAVRSGTVTTTLIPVKRNRYIGANYFAPPSDTLLGVQAGLEQIVRADLRTSPHAGMAKAADSGRALLCEYRADLNKSVLDLAKSLELYERHGTRTLLCDVRAPRSAATDTRAERLRFVTNASVYATFQQSVRLGIVDTAELETILGRSLAQYKAELLLLFGRDGYIKHSLDCKTDSPALAIALDFVNVQHGFWDFKNETERALFSTTADFILAEPRFRIPDTFHFFVSADNPRKKFIHRIATPSYQGRSAWPTFNVEFADRMLEYDEFSGTGNTGLTHAISCVTSTTPRKPMAAIRTSVRKRPSIPHMGVPWRDCALMVSPFPERLEQSFWRSSHRVAAPNCRRQSHKLLKRSYSAAIATAGVLSPQSSARVLRNGACEANFCARPARSHAGVRDR
jgi:hypothetical protein